MFANAALRSVCRRHAGFDPATLSPDQLRDRVPEIVAALNAELMASLGSLAVIQKSALQRAGSIIPNPGITRDEHVPLGESGESLPDANSVFDSLFPG